MASRNSLCDGAKADSGDGPFLLNSTFAPKQGDLSVAETRGVGDDGSGAEQIVSLEWNWSGLVAGRMIAVADQSCWSFKTRCFKY